MLCQKARILRRWTSMKSCGSTPNVWWVTVSILYHKTSFNRDPVWIILTMIWTSRLDSKDFLCHICYAAGMACQKKMQLSLAKKYHIKLSIDASMNSDLLINWALSVSRSSLEVTLTDLVSVVSRICGIHGLLTFEGSFFISTISRVNVPYHCSERNI